MEKPRERTQKDHMIEQLQEAHTHLDNATMFAYHVDKDVLFRIAILMREIRLLMR